MKRLVCSLLVASMTLTGCRSRRPPPIEEEAPTAPVSRLPARDTYPKSLAFDPPDVTGQQETPDHPWLKCYTRPRSSNLTLEIWCNSKYDNQQILAGTTTSDAEITARIQHPEQSDPLPHVSMLPMLGEAKTPGTKKDYDGKMVPETFEWRQELQPNVDFKVDFGESLPPLTVALAKGKYFTGEPTGWDELMAEPVLKFGDDEAAPPAGQPHSALVSYGPYLFVLGPAKILREADWVAFSKQLPLRDAAKKCGGYKEIQAKAGDPSRSFDLQLEDLEVVLRERHSGKELAKQTFAAKKECPYGTTDGVAKSTVGQNEVVKWVTAQLKGSAN